MGPVRRGRRSRPRRRAGRHRHRRREWIAGVDLEISGGGFTFGGGIQYHVAPAWALGAGRSLDRGRVQRGEARRRQRRGPRAGRDVGAADVRRDVAADDAETVRPPTITLDCRRTSARVVASWPRRQHREWVAPRGDEVVARLEGHRGDQRSAGRNVGKTAQGLERRRRPW